MEQIFFIHESFCLKTRKIISSWSLNKMFLPVSALISFTLPCWYFWILWSSVKTPNIPWGEEVKCCDALNVILWEVMERHPGHTG